MRDLRLRVAIQKSGRLADKSTQLFERCGLDFDTRKDRLIRPATNFPLDLMLVRDDDIPAYVADGLCDLGIVGENIAREKFFDRFDLQKAPEKMPIEKVKSLGFGSCRLSIAFPENLGYLGLQSLQRKKIATSFPVCLKNYLKQNFLEAEIVELNGCVEIAPSIGIADAVFDVVSSGATLRSNGLKEVQKVFESQACLIKATRSFPPDLQTAYERLLQRISGVMTASKAKYVMMNAPKNALSQIREILPGMESPSVIPLESDPNRVAIHAVAREDVFWETIEKLKACGASSILVLPIEKAIE